MLQPPPDLTQPRRPDRCILAEEQREHAWQAMGVVHEARELHADDTRQEVESGIEDRLLVLRVDVDVGGVPRPAAPDRRPSGGLECDVSSASEPFAPIVGRASE